MAEWHFDNKKYAKTKSSNNLSYRIKKHQSVLLKKLGDNNEQLQINKVTNLKIAVKELNGILIKPKETFSFCKLVGLPTKQKGYLLGMELSFGEAKAGIGGGICQISNLVHWLVIHSPLTVTDEFCPLEVVQQFFTITEIINLQTIQNTLFKLTYGFRKSV
jgi:vancomycin resistance protein VanW